jgi:hypothetical protein
MMMNPLDYIVLISLLPVIPLIATRESWLPKKVPPFIFGVYLLYCAFAAWYFKVGWFTTIEVGAGREMAKRQTPVGALQMA